MLFLPEFGNRDSDHRISIHYPSPPRSDNLHINRVAAARQSRGPHAGTVRVLHHAGCRQRAAAIYRGAAHCWDHYEKALPNSPLDDSDGHEGDSFHRVERDRGRHVAGLARRQRGDRHGGGVLREGMYSPLLRDGGPQPAQGDHELHGREEVLALRQTHTKVSSLRSG